MYGIAFKMLLIFFVLIYGLGPANVGAGMYAEDAIAIHAFKYCEDVDDSNLRMHCQLRQMIKMRVENALQALSGGHFFNQTMRAEPALAPVVSAIKKKGAGDKALRMLCHWMSDCKQYLPKTVTIRNTRYEAYDNHTFDEKRIYFDLEAVREFRIRKINFLFLFGKYMTEFKDRDVRVVGTLRVYESDDPNFFFTLSFFDADKQYKESLETGNHWMEYEATGLVRKWLKNSTNYFGVAARMQVYAGNTDELLLDQFLGTNGSLSYLEITNATRIKTEKLQFDVETTQCADSSTKNDTCCIYSFEVPVTRILFPHITSPPSIKMRYCAGSCGGTLVRHNAHSEFLRLQNGTYGCCTPTATSTIGILYQSYDGNHYQGTLQEFNVDACGCR